MRIRTSGLSNYVKTNMKADLPQVGDRLPVGPRQPASPHRHMRIIQRILRRLRAKEHNANLILGLRKQFPLDKQRRALQGRVEEAVPFVVRFCLIFLCCGCARLSTKRTGQCAAWTMRSPSFCSRASAANGPGPGRSSLRWDPTSGSAPPDTSR